MIHALSYVAQASSPDDSFHIKFVSHPFKRHNAGSMPVVTRGPPTPLAKPSHRGTDEHDGRQHGGNAFTTPNDEGFGWEELRRRGNAKSFVEVLPPCARVSHTFARVSMSLICEMESSKITIKEFQQRGAVAMCGFIMRRCLWAALFRLMAMGFQRLCSQTDGRR